METANHKQQCKRRTYWEEKDPKYIKAEGYFYPAPYLSFFVKPYAFKGNPEDLCTRYKPRGSTRKSKSVARVISMRGSPRRSTRKSVARVISMRGSPRRSTRQSILRDEYDSESKFYNYKESVEKEKEKKRFSLNRKLERKVPPGVFNLDFENSLSDSARPVPLSSQLNPKVRFQSSLK